MGHLSAPTATNIYASAIAQILNASAEFDTCVILKNMQLWFTNGWILIWWLFINAVLYCLLNCLKSGEM